MAPLVSVLMPVRDAEATLGLTLRSITRQRGVSWECVVIDDGSSDQSGEQLARAAALEPRIRVLTRPPGGIVLALEQGLSACRGQYVARMDADDIMHARRLELQVQALAADASLAGVGCHVRIFPRRDLLAGRRTYEAWLNSLRTAAEVARDAFVECPIAHPSLMLRRSVLERFGYRDMGWPEDYDLVLRLLGDGQRLGVVPRRLLCWRDGPKRLSRNSPSYALERFVACKAHHLAAGFLRQASRYVLWGYGDTGRSLAKALAGYGKQPSAIVEVHPGRLGQRILGAPVFGPLELPDFMRLHGPQPLVASVARPGPRGEVRAALSALGFVELRDYVCAA